MNAENLTRNEVIRGKLVRVVLIEIKGYGPTFLAEDRDPREAVVEDGPPSGMRGWFAAKTRALKGEMDRTRGVLGATIGRVWRGLQRLVAPDEHLLRGLRKAEALTIDHPASMDFAAVEAAWDGYLARKVRKHAVWFAVDALLAPASIVLAVVPGPNVVGYWVLYRAFAHGLVLLGARRARRGGLAPSLRPLSDLDDPIAPGDHGRISRLAATLELPGLGLLLSRIAPDGPPE